MKKLLIIIFSLLFTVMGAFSSSMMKHSRGMSYHIKLAEMNLYPSQMILRYKTEIGLTAEQEKKIQALQMKYREISIKQNTDIKILELKLSSLFKADNPSRKLIENKIREIASKKTNMVIDKFNYLLDLKQILTKEQLTKIDNLRRTRMNRMKSREMKERMKMMKKKRR